MALDYRQAQFLLSAVEPDQLPADHGVEVAFAGRSNAGKSSALNTITDQKQLARVSKTPGRTQQINVFPLSESQRLIDLPGYGYAKAPAAMRAHWQRTLPLYLETRQSLRGLILIMDIRHPMGPLDQQMLAWCQAAQLAVHIVLSKADKLKRGAAGNTLQRVRPQAHEICKNVSVQLFSSASRAGLNEARAQLDQWLETDMAIKNPEGHGV